MGSLKALQEWCRLQCEDYNDVDVKNMSTSFRDGLAFCAIIHRFRPDLIDFSSLSKENVYENNRLAFEVAEAQLGIPALLDPEDMVSMNVPDRLSIITYVSQYYNFFTIKSHVNPPTTKRPAGSGQGEPAQKRPMAPLEDKALGPEPAQTRSGKAEPPLGCGTLSSTCSACHKHVHLVQRFLVEGRLYHRHCFRCRQCSSTLLPGSYKMGTEAGSLVCTHHFPSPALANQNGRPDLSVRPVEDQSARIGRSLLHQTPPSEKERETTPPPAADQNAVISNSLLADDTPTSTSQSDSLIIKEEPSVPPNPFGESDDDEGGEEEEEAVTKEEKKEEQRDEIPTPAKEPSPEVCVADTLPAPTPPPGGVTRPVPAPRRVPEATPPPRPAPRARPQHTPERSEVVAARLRQKPLLPPKPRERSHSPGSQSNDTPKSKDPPWLALVQSEPKKKPAPPPPPTGLATPPCAGSLSSLGAGGTPPPPPANPFDEEGEEEEGEEEGDGGEDGGRAAPTPPGLAASHPWYSITQAAGAEGAETAPHSGGSSSRSSSPGGGGGGRGRKRPAPRAPHAPSAEQVLPYSLPSSCSPSPACSVESLSSGPQDHPVTKSVSEPSICGPPAATCPQEPSPAISPSSPPNVPTNTSSAPATPQTNRSEGGRGPRHPPPRPPTSATTPSLLAPETPTANGKRTCKENPFNRKPSPSRGSAKARPPPGPRPARPPAPGHGFPLIKRKVQSDQYVPPEDIHGEMKQLEEELDRLEQRGVELESTLRNNPNDDEEEHLLVEWFTLIHDKHLLVRREAELVYTSKQQGLEERQGDVEYELRCLLNKPEKDWNEADRSREQDLMADLVTIIEQRNQIINSMDQDRQRDEEEDKLMAAMLKKKDFNKEPDGEEEKEKKKKKAKFKPMKVLKRLSHKGEPGKTPSPRKDKS